jgi:hypothetical protein
VFEVHGVDSHGKVVVRKTLRRDAVAHFFANLPPCLVGMEASNGAHYWTKVLTEFPRRDQRVYTTAASNKSVASGQWKWLPTAAQTRIMRLDQSFERDPRHHGCHLSQKHISLHALLLGRIIESRETQLVHPSVSPNQ